MGENYPNTDDLPPRDLGGRPLEFLGDPTCSLAEDFDLSLRRCLDHRVTLESCWIRVVPQQKVTHLDHVEDALDVSPQSTTASATTRAATRGRRPCSVTTSTSH